MTMPEIETLVGIMAGKTTPSGGGRHIVPTRRKAER